MSWMRRILHRKHKGHEVGFELVSLLIGEEFLVKIMEAKEAESTDVPFEEKD